jgi:hypothetical protein
VNQEDINKRITCISGNCAYKNSCDGSKKKKLVNGLMKDYIFTFI